MHFIDSLLFLKFDNDMFGMQRYKNLYKNNMQHKVLMCFTFVLSGASLDFSLERRSLSRDFLSTSLLSLRLLASRSLDADSLPREVESLLDEFSAIEIFVRPAAADDFDFSELVLACSTFTSFDVTGVFVSDVGGAFLVT